MNQIVDNRIPMPECLTKQPLVFGNREQIRAIEEVSRIVAEAEEPNERGEKKRAWRVSVTFEATENITVWAVTEEEAEELAIEEVDGNYDLDTTAWAREIKDNADQN